MTVRPARSSRSAVAASTTTRSGSSGASTASCTTDRSRSATARWSRPASWAWPSWRPGWPATGSCPTAPRPRLPSARRLAERRGHGPAARPACAESEARVAMPAGAKLGRREASGQPSTGSPRRPSLAAMTSLSAPPRSNDLCWCGSGRKYKRCHKPFEGRVLKGTVSPVRPVPDQHRPPAVRRHRRRPVRWDEPRVKSPEIIDRMREAGRMAAEVLRLAGDVGARPASPPTRSTRYVHELTIERGAYPSPLNYNGFPKSVCTSLNEVICHGIPDSTVVRDGDIVNLDVTVYIDGVHGDTNATFLVGDVDPESRRLVRVTEECMWRGIEAVRPGRPGERHRPGHRGPRQGQPLRRGAGVHRARHRRAVPHRPADPPLLRPERHHGHAARA